MTSPYVLPPQGNQYCQIQAQPKHQQHIYLLCLEPICPIFFLSIIYVWIVQQGKAGIAEQFSSQSLVLIQILIVYLLMEATSILKSILMLVFFLEVTIFGNFVSRLQCFTNKAIMDLAMTFSGTLFLSIALIDVIPQAIEHFDQFLKQGANQSKFPLTMIIAMVMFIIIMWLDKILIGHSHDHQYEISFAAGPKKRDGQQSVELREQHHDEFQGDNPGTEHRHQQNNLTNEAAGTSTAVNWKPFVLQAGMSIHAFFQTLAVGLQGSTMSVISLATAIIVHKWAQGLTLGLLYQKQGFSRKTITIMIIIQGAINVLGLLTGSFLMGQGSFIMAFFMSMSAGTFLYISLAEVLQEQLKVFTKGKMSMVLAANIFIACIVWLQKSEEQNQT